MTGYGIVGFGRIGRRLAARLTGAPDAPPLAAVLVRPADAGAAAGVVGADRICTSIDAFVARRPDIAVECASAAALIETGPALLSAGIVRRLEPALGETAIAAEYCPTEGKINPLRATFAVAARARALGARFRRGSDVHAIEPTGGGYRVTTSRGDILCRRIVNAAGAWTPQIAAMVGVRLPVKGAPLQMIVSEPAPPLVRMLLAHADRHLSLKQMASGAFIIGGGWTAELDARRKLSQAIRSSVEGNLWVACRVLPALADLHAIRIWAGMNVNVDGAPILGEVPGMPGFFNCVASNGYTLAPVLARLTAEMMTGRSTSLAVTPYSLARFS